MENRVIFPYTHGLMCVSGREERVCVNMLYQCKNNPLMLFRASLTTALSVIEYSVT